MNFSYFSKNALYLWGAFFVKEVQAPVLAEEVRDTPNTLRIPSLEITAPVVYVDEKGEKAYQDALQHGVVHYPGTARPGQAGNFFVTGHSSYYPLAKGDYKSVFARLHELESGDEYWVYFGGDKHRYVVRSKKEVQPTDVTVLDQPVDARVATLMTCTPIGTTLRRLIVRAEEVDLKTGKPLAVGERADQDRPSQPLLEALPI